MRPTWRWSFWGLALPFLWLVFTGLAQESLRSSLFCYSRPFVGLAARGDHSPNLPPAWVSASSLKYQIILRDVDLRSSVLYEGPTQISSNESEFNGSGYKKGRRRGNIVFLDPPPPASRLQARVTRFPYEIVVVDHANSGPRGHRCFATGPADSYWRFGATYKSSWVTRRAFNLTLPSTAHIRPISPRVTRMNRREWGCTCGA